MGETTFFKVLPGRHIRCRALVLGMLSFLIVLVPNVWSDAANAAETTERRLTQVSLEQLGQIEVTTVSKEPVKANQILYVVTQQDIQPPVQTSIPEALRLVPGVKVARIDSDTWSLGFADLEALCLDQY